jgi:hypothetical protein
MPFFEDLRVLPSQSALAGPRRTSGQLAGWVAGAYGYVVRCRAVLAVMKPMFLNLTAISA